MAGSIFGEIFRVITFGESHGPMIGAVIDGLQPGIEIDTELMQYDLDRRKPGQSKVTTARKEDDRLQIVSGVFEGKTTGTPLCILIKNKDQRSRDYSQIKDIFRPGHAAYTFLKKYGIYDYRGGGRASGRETAMRVAAGAIAKQLLRKRDITISGYVRQIGEIEMQTYDPDQIEQNMVRCPDPQAAEDMVAAITQAKEEGDSMGGIIEVRITGLPIGLGDPVFDKMEAEMAKALMSIGAVKGFDIGSGFRSATLRGSESNDEFRKNPDTGEVETVTNNSGGTLGGITSGAELRMRIAVKPTSSINKEQKTVNTSGEEVKVKIGGRHDPCICPRVVPVAEAMAALVLIDLMLIQERLEYEQPYSPEHKLATIDHQLLLLLAERQKLATEANSSLTAEKRQAIADILELDAELLAALWEQIETL